MTPAEIQALFGILDLATSAYEFVSKKIAQAKAEGVILTAEQEARLAKIEQVRKDVGL